MKTKHTTPYSRMQVTDLINAPTAWPTTATPRPINTQRSSPFAGLHWQQGETDLLGRRHPEPHAVGLVTIR